MFDYLHFNFKLMLDTLILGQYVKSLLTLSSAFVSRAPHLSGDNGAANRDSPHYRSAPDSDE